MRVFIELTEFNYTWNRNEPLCINTLGSHYTVPWRFKSLKGTSGKNDFSSVTVVFKAEFKNFFIWSKSHAPLFRHSNFHISSTLKCCDTWVSAHEEENFFLNIYRIVNHLIMKNTFFEYISWIVNYLIMKNTFFEYMSNRKSFDHEEYFFWLYLEL